MALFKGQGTETLRIGLGVRGRKGEGHIKEAKRKDAQTKSEKKEHKGRQEVKAGYSV